LPRRSNKEETRIQAEAKFKRKEAQAAGAKAVTDYEAANRAIIERTARLKALRLAKEATEARNQTAPASSARKRRLSRPR
jgi:hypothetical protein